MCPSGSHTKLIYHVNTVYEDWIGSWFTLAHKNILVTMQGCIEDSK